MKNGKNEHINYIKSPIADIYKAITTQEGLSAVWTVELIVKPELGFVNEFDFGDNYATKMKTLELSENKKILWECVSSDPEWIVIGISFDLTEKDAARSIAVPFGITFQYLKVSLISVS
ncbi:SRPBCC domain-containing protein [Dyadobacter chenhuakuii]|uniref:SRPBCC domain-containing protein n=1 Tax=Dyadobacter chenhuakuii TaxID=2909339 RepID=A0ABY4XP92_9BACT|nr:SRPBCC domain-containing protein [Dyadobacter chenhuakuii]MCF2494414.1 SRPBCC domain-containing protein [Dyadobacter chenhuakuii]USJ32260.1 SRPBCC domain-containing protein [Dyadobacter chenhuakuii]